MTKIIHRSPLLPLCSYNSHLKVFILITFLKDIGCSCADMCKNHEPAFISQCAASQEADFSQRNCWKKL